jgi:hypothetical protein
MPKELLLVVDDITRDKLAIPDAVVLYPSCRNNVPWGITIDEYLPFNTSLSLMIDATADYLTKIPLVNAQVSQSALRKLVRANAAQLLYVIFDRLIRVVRFMEYNKDASIALVGTRSFRTPQMYNDLLPLSRDSWEYNQYLVNEILRDNKRVVIPQKDVLFPDDCWDLKRWADRYGFNFQAAEQAVAVKRPSFWKQPLLVARAYYLAMIEKISAHGKVLPVYALGFNEYLMMVRGFFWPLGKFCKLPRNFADIAGKKEADQALRLGLVESTKDFFARQALTLLQKMGTKHEIAEQYASTVARLFFQLFPASMLENFDAFSDWSITQLQGHSLRHYFSWNTANTDLCIHYNTTHSRGQYYCHR